MTTRLTAALSLMLACTLFAVGCASPDPQSRPLPDVDQDRQQPERADDSAPEEAVERLPVAAADLDDFGIIDLPSALALAALVDVEVPLEDRLVLAESAGLDMDAESYGRVLYDYHRFIEAREAAIHFGGSSLESLAAHTTADVILDEVVELAPSEDLGVVVDEFDYKIHPIAVWGDQGGVWIHDCLETTTASRLLGLASTKFVEQVVELHPSGDEWVVADLQTLHSGFADGEFGCTPPAYVGPLYEATIEFFVAHAELMAYPEEPLDGIATVSTPEMLEQVRETTDALVSIGAHVPDPVDLEVQLLGADPLMADGSFLMSVCTVLPEGMATRRVTDDSLIPPSEGGHIIAPMSIYREVLVVIDAGDEGQPRPVISGVQFEEADASCAG